MNLPCRPVYRLCRVYFLLASVALSACGPRITIPDLTTEELPQFEASGNYPHNDYRIEPGDRLDIKYPFHSEMNQSEVIVRPDGKISVISIGELKVADLSTTELEQLLVQRTSDRLRDPEVVVTVVKFAEKYVYVGGEVKKPGSLSYTKDLTPLQAVIASGGFLDTARLDSVILVRKGKGENNFISRKLNLQETVVHGTNPPLYLAPHDIVFVPRTGVANADLWVQQHLSKLLFVGVRAATPPFVP